MEQVPCSLQDTIIIHNLFRNITEQEESLWEQESHKELVKFLQHRHQELVVGGQMVHVEVGSVEDTGFSHHSDIWTCVDTTLEDMIGSEVLRRENVVSPSRLRKLTDYTKAFKEVPGLKLLKLEPAKTVDVFYEKYQSTGDPKAYADGWTGLVQATILPSLKLERFDGFSQSEFLAKLHATLLKNPNPHSDSTVIVLHYEKSAD